MPPCDRGGPGLHYQLLDRAHRPAERLPAGTAVVVLLNGLFQRWDSWDRVLPWLEGLAVLRYDMRGQGRSPLPPGPCTPAQHAADLRALLAHLGVERQVLVGLSNGGVVALCAALAGAAGLDGMVLCCTTAHLDVAARAAIASWGHAVRAGGVGLRLRVTVPWGFGATFLERHPELLEEAVLAEAARSAPTPEAHEQLVAGLLAMPDLRPQLPALRVPALVLAGEEDLLFPPRHGAAIAAGLPAAELRVLPGVGHSAHVESPELLGRAIAAFVRARVAGNERGVR